MLRPLRIAAYGLKERLGLWDRRLREEVAKKAPFLWAHGASVGEVQLTLRLLEEFRPYLPWPILLTSMTPQGLGVARGKVDIALPFPIPLGLPIRTFLRRINPRAILIAETELWPPLLWEAERKGIPVVLFNARISDGSFKRFLAFRPLFRKALGAFSLILVRSEKDYGRFVKLGAPPERVVITGDLKFLKPFNPSSERMLKLKEELHLGRERIIVSGSTHRGEEELILEAFLSLRGSMKVRLIIAPRHIERAGEVKRLAEGFGLSVVLRSDYCDVPWDVLILDTVGELRDFYGLADVAIVGGSFVKGIGGHNLLEPLVWGVPTLHGPYVDNFALLSERLQALGAAMKVTEPLSLAIGRVLANPVPARERAKRAEILFEEGERALRKTVEMILKVLGVGR